MYTRVEPGINYEGKVGVHKSMSIIMKGERELRREKGGAQGYSTM